MEEVKTKVEAETSMVSPHQRIKDEHSEILEQKPPIVDNHSKIMDDDARAERFKKYEAEYTNYLMAKYFSDKDIFGDDIFDKTTVIGEETLKAGRFRATESYADPVAYLEKKRRLKEEGATSDSTKGKPPTNASNGNLSLAK